MTKTPENNRKKENSSKSLEISIILSFTVIALALIAVLGISLHSCAETARENLPGSYFKRLSDFIDAMAEKRALDVSVGTFFKEKRLHRFQFKKRTLTLDFQIMRWREFTGGKSSWTGPGHIAPPDVKVAVGQYSVAKASGRFEITFYIDLDKQNGWKYEWNGKAKRLTVLAPPFNPPYAGCDTPALTSPLETIVTVDCVTFDEDETKRLLEKAVPNLKRKAAMAQLKGVREDARRSLKEFFEELIPKLVNAPKNAENDINVEIIFRDELQPNKNKKEKAL
jgi:hypothetical protein